MSLFESTQNHTPKYIHEPSGTICGLLVLYISCLINYTLPQTSCDVKHPSGLVLFPSATTTLTPMLTSGVTICSTADLLLRGYVRDLVPPMRQVFFFCSVSFVSSILNEMSKAPLNEAAWRAHVGGNVIFYSIAMSHNLSLSFLLEVTGWHMTLPLILLCLTRYLLVSVTQCSNG